MYNNNDFMQQELKKQNRFLNFLIIFAILMVVLLGASKYALRNVEEGEVSDWIVLEIKKKIAGDNENLRMFLIPEEDGTGK